MAHSKSKPEASTAAAAKVPANKPVKPTASPAASKASLKAAATKVVAPKVVVPEVVAPKAAAPVAPAAKMEPKAVPAAKVAPTVEAILRADTVPESSLVSEAAPQSVKAEPVAPAPEPIEPAIIASDPVAAEAIPAKITFPNLKDIYMTTDFNANISETMTGAIGEVQARMQSAYDKSTGMVSEMTELAKGNVEAVVESTKLFATGVQDLGKSYADEAKSAYETVTADIKEMAAIKSPTELFQLQGKIMRRNFDMLIAATSKSTDAALKLANEAMAPISGRVNVAAEKLSKVAA